MSISLYGEHPRDHIPHYLSLQMIKSIDPCKIAVAVIHGMLPFRINGPLCAEIILAFTNTFIEFLASEIAYRSGSFHNNNLVITGRGLLSGIMTTSGATSDDKVGIMTTPGFQQRNILGHYP